MSEGENRRFGLLFKIGVTWLFIFALFAFLISSRDSQAPVRLSVMPQTPRTGQPVVATFVLANPTGAPATTAYELYVNGVLAESGSATLVAGEKAEYQYAGANMLARGEQLNFVLKTTSNGGSTVNKVSLPAWSPQLMSSFVSFAAFSTSVMSSMISMQYFDTIFNTGSGLNSGLIIAAILIALLVFMEFGQVMASRNTVIKSYQASFATVSSLLFIIFVGMVLTRVMLILMA